MSNNIVVGTYGEILVLRSERGWAELPHLSDLAADPTHAAHSLPAGWWLVMFKETEPQPHWMPTLVGATGAPVLWCTITALDAAYVRGLSQAGVWEGWLKTGGVDEEVAAQRITALDLDELLDEGGQDAVDDAMRRLGQEAVGEIDARAPVMAAAIGRWALEAGHVIDLDVLCELLLTGDAFGTRHLNDLLLLLRLTDRAVV